MIKLGLPRVSKKGEPRHSLPKCGGARRTFSRGTGAGCQLII